MERCATHPIQSAQRNSCTLRNRSRSTGITGHDRRNTQDWLEDLFMAVQDAIFDGQRIWGRDETINTDDAMLFVVEGFKKLSDVQRCQLVLLRDLHSPLPFISLAVVVGMLGFDTYADLLCEGLQPDSEREQTIRCQSAFIALLGQLWNGVD